VIFAAAIVWFAGKRIAVQWQQLEDVNRRVDPHWLWVIAASLVVFAAYALLIEVWVVHLRVWGATLSFVAAARMWFMLAFGRYVPGKVWGLVTLGVMAHRRGVRPEAALGSNILVTLIGMVAGLAVIVATGPTVIDKVLAERGVSLARWVVPVGIAVAVGGLLLVPVILPAMARAAARVTGRAPVLPQLPMASVWIVALGNATAWVLYGVAFQLFVKGMFGAAGGAGGYIAVYTAAYLLGFVSFIPAGAFVRESGLILGLTALGLATAPEAAFLAVASRVWITILEVVPGLIFFLIRTEGD
jgi:hypothetical protein